MSEVAMIYRIVSQQRNCELGIILPHLFLLMWYLSNLAQQLLSRVPSGGKPFILHSGQKKPVEIIYLSFGLCVQSEDLQELTNSI